MSEGDDQVMDDQIMVFLVVPRIEHEMTGEDGGNGAEGGDGGEGAQDADDADYQAEFQDDDESAMSVQELAQEVVFYLVLLNKHGT